MDDIEQHLLRSSPRESVGMLPDFVNQGELHYGVSGSESLYPVAPRSPPTAMRRARPSDFAPGQYQTAPGSLSPEPPYQPSYHPIGTSGGPVWFNEATNAFQGEWSNIGLESMTFDLDLVDTPPSIGYNSPQPVSGYSYEQAAYSAIPTNYGTSDQLTPSHFGHTTGVQIQALGWAPDEQLSVTTTELTQSSSVATSPRVGTPSTSHDGRFRCDPCMKVFGASRDLNRHKDTQRHKNQHASHGIAKPLDNAKYRCRCGYEQTRKDLYCRHLRTCKLKQILSAHYTCRCGYRCTDKTSHRTHVDECGKGRPGRPKNHGEH